MRLPDRLDALIVHLIQRLLTRVGVNLYKGPHK